MIPLRDNLRVVPVIVICQLRAELCHCRSKLTRLTPSRRRRLTLLLNRGSRPLRLGIKQSTLLPCSPVAIWLNRSVDMRRLASMAIGLILAAASSLFGAEVSDTAAFRIPNSSFVALRGKLDLPAEGLWHVRAPADESVVQLYLVPPPEAGRRLLGRRMRAAIRQQRIDQSRWRVRMLHASLPGFRASA